MGVLYLIRHAQAAFGEADYDCLSSLGLEQASVLGQTLRDRLPKIDAVWTGGMKRHRDTARRCLVSMNSPVEPKEARGFDEYDHTEIIVRSQPIFADHARLKFEMANAPDPRHYFQLMFSRAVERWAGGRFDGDYTESWPAFRARCLKAYAEVLAALGKAGTGLVFTSGGPITVICQSLLGLEDAAAFRLNWNLVNGSITKVVFGERGGRLFTFNEHGHYEDARPGLVTYR